MHVLCDYNNFRGGCCRQDRCPRWPGGNSAELLARLRPRFARIEPFLQARKYIRAVMSELPKRNGWTIAEHVRDRTPDKTQRLLNRAVWDERAAMAEVRWFAVTGLERAARTGGRRRGRLVIGALDETGPGEERRMPRPASNASTWAARTGWRTGSTPCTCRMCGRRPGTR